MFNAFALLCFVFCILADIDVVVVVVVNIIFYGFLWDIINTLKMGDEKNHTHTHTHTTSVYSKCRCSFVRLCVYETLFKNKSTIATTTVTKTV